MPRRKTNYLSCARSVAAIPLMVAAFVGYAADIESVANGLWTAGSTWSNGLAPTADNDYFVSSGFLVRGPGISGPGSYNFTFDGAGLVVRTGGTLNLVSGNSGTNATASYTIPRFSVEEGGVLALGVTNIGNISRTLLSPLSLPASGSVTVRIDGIAGGYSNTLTLAPQSVLSGGADIILDIDSQGVSIDGTRRKIISVVSEDNPFSGDWIVSSRNISAGSRLGGVYARGRNALGIGGVYLSSSILSNEVDGGIDSLREVEVGQNSILRLNADWLNPTASLRLTGSGGTVELRGDGRSAVIGNLAGVAGTTIRGVNSNQVFGVNSSVDTLYSGLIQGGVALLKGGLGRLSLEANNSYQGGTTISAGALQLGIGGSAGGITGDVFNNGTLIFNRSDAVNFAGAISGAGGVSHLGSGVTTLSGDSSAFTGSTSVFNGTLLVTGILGAPSHTLSTLSGGVLGGTGTIGGDASIQDGELAPGASVGTLSILGNLELSAPSLLQYEFGEAGVAGGVHNDLTLVGGDLTLDGTLNVTESSTGTFGPGLYRIFGYGGALNDQGLVLGAMPSGSISRVQTSVAGQVNLVNSAGLTMEFWDGGAPINNGAVEGGGGIWQASAGNDNWTDSDGTINAPYTDGGFAVFAAAPGVVSIDNSLGAVTSGGMQFASDGYIVQGQELTLATGSNLIRVGDGTAPGADYVATIASPMIGAGGIDKADLGALVLTGNNTYSGGTRITSGTLQLGSGGAEGAIIGDVVNDGVLIFNRADSVEFDGAISGGGRVTQKGPGTVNLRGDSPLFSGVAEVMQGVLRVSGTFGNLASRVRVSSGGTLEGNGHIVGNVAVDDGTLSPGTSVGTLAVSGDVTLTPRSTYRAEIFPSGETDLLDVNGNVALNGAALKVIAAPGDYSKVESFRIVTASQGVVGEFDRVNTELPLLSLSVLYDQNNVFLAFQRNAQSFCFYGRTNNQCNTGDGVESLAPGNTVYDAVASLPDAEAVRGALDSLSGEIHASLKTAFIEGSNSVNTAINDRLVTADVASHMQGRYTAGLQEANLLNQPKGSQGALWLRGLGSEGTFGRSSEAARLEQSLRGFLFGGDASVNSWRVGAFTGFSESELDVDERRSSATLKNYYFGLYAGTQWDEVFLRSGISYGHHKVDTKRTVQFQNFNEITKSSYDANSVQGFGELAYRQSIGKIGVEPFLNVAHLWARIDDFSEKGGEAALSASSQDIQATYTTLGTRATAEFTISEVDYAVRGLVGWRRAFGDRTPHVTESFVSSDDFTVVGTPISKDAAVLGLGLDLAASEKFTLGASYQGQFASNLRQHGAAISLNWQF